MADGTLAAQNDLSGPPALPTDDEINQVRAQLQGQPAQSADPVLDQIQHERDKIEALPPEIRRQDPVTVAYHAEIAQQEQGGRTLNDNEKFAILDAIRRSAQGGPSQIQTEQQTEAQQATEGAKDNTFLENMGQPVAQAMAAPVIAGVGIFSPKTAVGMQQTMAQTYAPAQEGSAGQIAGKGVGLALNVAQLASMGPAAAVAYFAAQGFGEARTDVEARRQQGQDISAAQEWLQAGGEAVIQGLVAHYLNGLATGGGPLPLARLLPAAVLRAMQSTDGALITPIIARILGRSAEGAGAGAIQQIASNMLGKTTGVTPERGVLEGVPEAAAGGAFMGGLGQGVGEVRAGQELNVAQGQEKPANPFTGEEVSPQGETTPVSETREASAKNPFAKPVPEEGTPESLNLPVDERLAEKPGFVEQTEEMKRQAAESDELTGRVNDLAQARIGALESPEGRLPNETDLRTGKPEHPLLTIGRAEGKTIEPADVPEHVRADVEALQKNTGVDIVPARIEDAAGFANPKVPNAVAFDVNAPKESVLGILAHEITHTFQSADPAALDRLMGLIPKAYANRLWNHYESLAVKAGYTPEEISDYKAKYHDHEVIAEAVRESVNGNGVLKRTLLGDKSLWGTFQSAVERVLNKFTSKGRFVNELDDALRQHFEVKTKINEAAGGMQELPGGKPRQKNYLDIGHRWRGDGSEEIWWQDEDGVIQNQKIGDATGRSNEPDRVHLSGTHYEVGAEDADFRGRIDHKLKEISVATAPGTEQNPYGDRQQIAVAKRLESKYPGYTVYVGGKGGMISLDEAVGSQLLPKLVNIRHELPDEKPVGEKIIDAVNSVSPKNAVKFAASIETGFKKAVFDRNEPLWRMARSTPPGFVSKISNLDLGQFVRTVFGFGRYEKMTAGGKGNEFAGLRDTKGTKFIDPEIKQGLTRYWLFDPIAKEAAKGKTSARELLTFADDTRVAESTLERGENLVKKITLQAMQDKIDSLMEGLTGKTKAAGGGGEETAEPVEKTTAEEDAEKAAQDELVKTRKAIKDARAQIADLNALNAREGEGGGGKARTPAPTEEVLQRTKDKLAAYENILKKMNSGKPMEPGDVFTPADLAAHREKALSKPLTGIGKTDEEPVSNGIRDMAEARRFMEEAHADPNWDVVNEHNRRSRLWENSHMQVAVESGLLSEEAASRILQSHQAHADLHRVIEDSGVLPPLKKGEAGKYHDFRGSNREIDSPTANMLQTTERLYRAADENLAKRMVLEHATQVGGAQEVPQARTDTISVKENGETKHYQVDPEIAKAVDMWKNHSMIDPIYKKILRVPGLIKLYANIMSPIFSATHLARQTFNRVALSQEGGALNLEGIRASLSMFSPKYKQMADVLNGTMGGAGDFRSGVESYHKLISKTLAELDGKPNTLVMLARKAWEGYGKIGEWSDAANRTAEFALQYRKGKARGLDEATAQQLAAAKSRELCDFAVSGTVVKAVNDLMYVPFIKAEMQGVRRMYDLARTKPALAAQRALIYGLAPALAPILYAMSQGKKELDEYLDRDITHRSMYSIFKVGDLDLFIPVGQSQYPAKALVELLFDKHPDAKRFREAVMASGIVPRPAIDTGSILPFSGIREAQANYDPFFGKTIVPPDENNAALSLRHIDSASALSQMLSKVALHAGMEIDPRKIDHVLSQDIGGLANVAKSVSDLGKPGLPSSVKAATLTGQLRLPPGYSAESFQAAMQKAQYYEDLASPQYKAMQHKMSESFDATDTAERNARVEDARGEAEKLNAFYEQHGDNLLAFKQANQKTSRAMATYKDLTTAADKAAWARANPDQLELVRAEPAMKRISARLTELRTALMRPTLPEPQEAAINRELDRLYQRAAELTGH